MEHLDNVGVSQDFQIFYYCLLRKGLCRTLKLDENIANTWVFLFWMPCVFQLVDTFHVVYIFQQHQKIN